MEMIAFLPVREIVNRCNTWFKIKKSDLKSDRKPDFIKSF